MRDEIIFKINKMIEDVKEIKLCEVVVRINNSK